MEEVGVNLQGHDAGALPGPLEAPPRARWPRRASGCSAKKQQKLIDMDAVVARRGRARRAGRHHLRRRDRQDRRPRGQPRPGRQPRGRAARHPADRRRHDGQHQARHGAHRSHPVHRRRRVPRLEAVGSDSGAAGPLSDPRRARAARPGGVRAHPHRAAQRADQAVHGAAGDRGRRRCSSPTTAIATIAEFAARRQRAHREHRRAPAAHGHGAAARRGVVRGAGPRRTSRSRSTRPTCAACSRTS